jgi:uncharacterized RDD family membrane protein YckC
MEYEDTTTIATPEGVELELRLAGVGSRFSSASLDYLIKFIAFGAFALLVGLLFGGTVATVAISVGFFLAVVVYDIVFEVRAAGATPGKRALGVRVLLADGAPVGVRASSVRNLLRLIEGPALLYVPAVISILVTRRNQRLGDLAAGTVVARQSARGGPAFNRYRPPGQRQLGDWDVSSITPEELAAVRSFLARRHGFDPAARTRIASMLAFKLRDKVAGANTPAFQPERFLEELERAKSDRT